MKPYLGHHKTKWYTTDIQTV